MASSSDTIQRGALVGVILVSTTLGANALTVARCNVLVEGVYRPALMIEAEDGARVHHIGEDGLTRSTVFNEEAALAWASALYGSSFEWNPASTCNVEGDLTVVVTEGGDGPEEDVADYLKP